jgi:hypothetical protein
LLGKIKLTSGWVWGIIYSWEHGLLGRALATIGLAGMRRVAGSPPRGSEQFVEPPVCIDILCVQTTIVGIVWSGVPATPPPRSLLQITKKL